MMNSYYLALNMEDEKTILEKTLYALFIIVTDVK